MSTFEGFALLMVFSSPERPAPGSWNFPKQPPSTMPPHPGLQVQTMIIYGVGLIRTIAKPRSFLQHPPPLVPPLLRGSRVYPHHHLIQPAKICTPFLHWRLLHRKIRPARPQRGFGTLTIQLEQKGVITPALLRTAKLWRASASRCNPTKVIVEFTSFCTRFFRYTMSSRNLPLCQQLSSNLICASSG